MAGADGGGAGSAGYDYEGAGYGVELTGDRSRNAARPLPGYSLRASPDPDWPGLDAGGELRYDPEVMREVAGWLRGQAQESQGLPGWLARSTSVSFGPSSWHEASHLRDASDQVGRAVADYLARVVADLEVAAGSITSAVDTYAGAEQANADTADAVNGRLPGAGGRESGPGPVVF